MRWRPGESWDFTPARAAARPIHLHVDLFVAPGREEEMKQNFLTVFKPVISEQPGFAGVHLLKLRSELTGKAPAGSSYRLIISFETEEQRLGVCPSIGDSVTENDFVAVFAV